MKRLLLILFLAATTGAFGQNLTGLWTGYLYNDSTNLDLKFEVAICESADGNTYAYSLTNFVIGNREAQGLKSIRVIKEKDEIVFVDLELVYNNYPTAPPKGVRQISTLTLGKKDTTLMLTGKFQTTRTRQAGRPVTGSIRLERRNDINRSLIIPILQKTKRVKEMCFLKPEQMEEPPEEKKQKEDRKPPIVRVDSSKKKPEPPRQVQELAKRKVETIQTLFVIEDSLRFDVYDNGFVDGDSISIIVNGKVFMEHIRLTDRANSKVLHLTPELGDSLQVVLFAENLGTITPNSGVLIISDGRNRSEVHFSGDLKNNKSVILRRRKK